MTFVLRKPWWLGVLALGLWQGCSRDAEPPVIGPNLVRNGSFESSLDPWWSSATDGGTVTISPVAADIGASGLVLHKTTDAWGSMAGQETEGHGAMQTFQIHARIKGAEGGERVSFSFSNGGFDVVAEPRWRTVSRLVLIPEASDKPSAIIAVVSDNSVAHVDDVSFATAQVTQGDADREEGNLLRNGSFESDLGLWNFWTNSELVGAASTSPEARYSGYSGMVLTRGAEGTLTTVKQTLPDPVFEREQYRFEAQVKGANGGEAVNLCLQINRDPWDGPCLSETAERGWKHLSMEVTIDALMDDERVGLLVSLGSEGTIMVDDVMVVRTEGVR